MPRARGFTLVELVTVLLLVGLLAVTVLPRFLTRGGFDEVIYRDRLAALLQQAQLMAMSRASQCSTLRFEAHRFGIPRRDPSHTACDASLPGVGEEYANPSLGIRAEEAVSSVILSAPAVLSFDYWGRPLDASGTPYASQLVIGIQGETSLKLCIETQGYIHDC